MNEPMVYYEVIDDNGANDNSKDTVSTEPSYPPPEIVTAKVVNRHHEEALNNPTVFMCELTPPEIRQSFIRKVYTTLWLQLAFTASCIGFTKGEHAVSEFLVSPGGIMMYYVSAILGFVLLCAFLCCTETMKQKPNDKIFLTLFTASLTYTLCFVSVFYKTQVVLLGGLSTLGMFSGLSLYAVQTKVDYTDCGNTLCILLLALILLGFMVPFVHAPVVQICYSVGGATLFSFYIVYDTQLIMGDSNRKIKFKEDDYVLAAVSLYLDLVNLFLYMLDILNGR
jgi:FtsH-binding integral membrane protein